MSKKDAQTPSDWQQATKLVRGGLMRSPSQETSEALYLTSGYIYDSAEQAAAQMAGDEPGYVYSRYNNPTVSMLEDRLALLEGAEACLTTASGMAAISASLIAPCQAGDRVVAATALFGSCRWIIANQLPKFGIETEFVDGTDMDAWEKALSKPTKLVLIESPSNPLLDAVDVKAVAGLAHKAGAKLILDNVFATPLLQKSFDLGADWIVYSATKHMDGQGRVLGGAILGPESDLTDIIQPWMRHTGPSISPFNAWVLLKGLETMELRVARQCDTAEYLANAMASHPAVAAVRYPKRSDHPHFAIHDKQMRRGGTLIAISLKGGQDAAYRFLNALQIIDISNNLGDAKSLACHPASTTHRVLSNEERASIGLDGSWVRISVGLEHSDDLAGDIEQALEQAG